MTTVERPLGGEFLETFLEEVEGAARAVLARFRIPHHDAEDLYQEAVLTLLEKIGEARDPHRWFLGTLQNRCRNYWRARRRAVYEAVDQAVLEALGDPDQTPAEEAELRCDLAGALERVSRRCRELLRRRYRLGDEPPEVAREMGYSLASIPRITKRCLSALSLQLVRGGYEEADHV